MSAHESIITGGMAASGGFASRLKASIRHLEERTAALSRWQVLLMVLGLVLHIAQQEVGWAVTTSFPVDDPSCRTVQAKPAVELNSTDMHCFSVPTPLPLQQSLWYVEVLRGLATATTIGLMVAIGRYHAARAERLKLLDAEPMRTRLWHSQVFRGMLLELLLVMPHVFVGFDDLVTNPTVYMVFVIAPFTRLYLVLRMHYHGNSLSQAPGQFIATLTRVNTTFAFIVKAALHGAPGRFLIGGLCVILVIVAYLLRIVETVGCADNDALKCTPFTFVDALYTVLVTITTVGYGSPFVARTPWGRILTLFVAILSYCSTAVAMTFLVRWMDFTPSEATVVHFIERNEELQCLRDVAARAIQAAWQYRRLYISSVGWKSGRLGLAYRPLSRRLPVEHKLLAAILTWRQQRRRVDQLAMDGDSNYGWLLANKMAIQLNQAHTIVMKMWRHVLPRDTALRFDNFLMGRPVHAAAPVNKSAAAAAAAATAAAAAAVYASHDELQASLSGFHSRNASEHSADFRVPTTSGLSLEATAAIMASRNTIGSRGESGGVSAGAAGTSFPPSRRGSQHGGRRGSQHGGRRKPRASTHSISSIGSDVKLHAGIPRRRSSITATSAAAAAHAAAAAIAASRGGSPELMAAASQGKHRRGSSNMGMSKAAVKAAAAAQQTAVARAERVSMQQLCKEEEDMPLPMLAVPTTPRSVAKESPTGMSPRSLSQRSGFHQRPSMKSNRKMTAAAATERLNKALRALKRANDSAHAATTAMRNTRDCL